MQISAKTNKELVNGARGTEEANQIATNIKYCKNYTLLVKENTKRSSDYSCD